MNYRIKRVQRRRRVAAGLMTRLAVVAAVEVNARSAEQWLFLPVKARHCAACRGFKVDLCGRSRIDSSSTFFICSVVFLVAKPTVVNVDYLQ